MSISARRISRWIAVTIISLVTHSAVAQGPGMAQYGGPTGAPVSYGMAGPGGWSGPVSYGEYGGGAPVPGVRYREANGTVTHMQERDPDAWDSNGWLEQTFEHVFLKSSFRLDYMHWSLDTPGDVALGAPVEGVRSTDVPFPVFDRTTGAARGLGVVPTLDRMSLRDVSGMRGTIEIPFKPFTFEYNAWFTQQTGDRYEVKEGDLGGIPSTTLLANGVAVADNALIYDAEYSADLTTELWGTEGNILFRDPLRDQFVSGYKLNLRPLVGFRYVQLKERLQQVGTDTNAGTIDPLTSVIDSENTNNLYGPTLGVRAEVVGRHVSFGIQPKITFGLNEYRANVSTQNLFAAGELRRISREDHVEYAPLFELNAYVKLHLHESFTVHVGYDYMWMDRVVRPWNTIYYDNTRVGGVDEPNVRVREHLRDFYLQGLTVGGEFRL